MDFRTLILDTLDEILPAGLARSELKAGSNSLSALGLTSLLTIRFSNLLSARCGARVPITAIFAHPTLESLAAHLGEPARWGVAPDDAHAPSRARHRDDVAIVGIALRVPGAADMTELWSLLARQECHILPMEEARLMLTRRLYPDVSTTREAGYLDDVAGFDAAFFKISPAEAEVMDPQQRLALMVSQEALEDAGMPSDVRDRVGVFFGSVWHDFAQLLSQHPERFDALTATGSSSSIIANRISYALGLTGPSVVFDTACSSSLVAVHYACRSLASGDCDAAVVGGVNVALDPKTTSLLDHFGGLSPRDRICAFDADADGFARGEGCVVLILRSLTAALADNQRIYAVIKGSAVNNDGASHGLTAPNPEAQARVIRDALSDAGVHPDDVAYVEAHGTGTPLGDPIEAAGLHDGYRTGERAHSNPLKIGSLKPNLGHLEAAAGVAGLAKAALVLDRREFLPMTGFRSGNPNIPFAEMNIKVQERCEPYLNARRMAVGVSSFGWGGTNAHVVLEEAPRIPGPRLDTGAFELGRGASGRPFVVVFSPQGGQWPGMLHRLLDAPIARAALEEFDAYFAEVSGRSLLKTLQHAGEPLADDVSAVQPVVTAFQIAVWKLLSEWNVVPDAVVGHSLGEIAAAHAAGAITLAEAAKLVFWYSQRQRETSSEGGMAICGVPADELAPVVAANEGVVIGGYNAPSATILSGPRRALESIVAALTQSARFARMIPVNRSVHSAFIDSIRGSLLADLAFLRPQCTAIDMISTCTGTLVAGTSLTADYWFQNLRNPVRYLDVMQGVCRGMTPVVLEIGPHPILTPSNADLLRACAPGSVALSSHARGEDEIECMNRMKSLLARELGLRRMCETPRNTLLAMSAHTQTSLAAYAGKLAASLATGSLCDLPSLAYTLNERRDHQAHRAALVASSAEELVGKLAELARSPDDETCEFEPAREFRAAFVFSGQGSQWVGMGRELIKEDPEFRDCVLRISRAFERHGCEGLYAKILLGSPDLCDDIAVVQPALFCLQVAYAHHWRSCGVGASAVVGHSMGEVAAAYVAGILTLNHACKVIAVRSRLLRRISGQGAMLFTELGFDAATTYLTEIDTDAGLAVSNSPTSCVFSGSPDALARLAARLDLDGIFNRWVQVDVASHSSQTDRLLSELEESLVDVLPSPPKVPFFSSVRDWDAREAPLGSARYWALNLRRTVMFADTVAAIMESGIDAFIEISPHPILLASVRQCTERAGRADLITLASAAKDGSAVVFLESLAQAYERGARVAWRSLRRSNSLVQVPPRAWDLEAYLPELRSIRHRQIHTAGLAAPALVLPRDEDELFFVVDFAERPDHALYGHEVHGDRLFSAAGFLALIRANLPDDAPRRAVADVLFHAPLLLRPADLPRVLVSFHRKEGTVRIHSRRGIDIAWLLHASASLAEGEASSVAHRRPVPIAAAAAAGYYPALAKAGYEFPHHAQILRVIDARSDEAWATIERPDAARGEGDALAAAYLDGLLQLVLAQLAVDPATLATHYYLVDSIGEVTWPVLPRARPVFAHARMVQEDAASRTLDLALVSEGGERLGGLLRVRLAKVPRAAAHARAERTAAAINIQDSRVVRTTLRAELGRVLRLVDRRVSATKPFRDQGLTSLMAIEFIRAVNASLNANLSPTATYNYPNLEALAAHLVQVEAREPRPAHNAVSATAAPTAYLDLEERLAHEIENLRLLIEA